MIFVILLWDRHIKMFQNLCLIIRNKILKDLECKKVCLEFISNHKNELNHILKLQMVRSVCMKFYSSIKHVSEFSKHIYGEFKASEVVVWVHKWNGIYQNSQIRIYEEHFYSSTDTFKMIITRSKILQDSYKYVEQVLKSQFGSYIAISFHSGRRERFLDKS